MGKSEGTKVLGKPRSRWEASIKVDIKKIGEDYILDSGCGPLAGSCERGNEPMGFVSNIIYFEAERPLGVQEALCSMDLCVISHIGFQCQRSSVLNIS